MIYEFSILGIGIFFGYVIRKIYYPQTLFHIVEKNLSTIKKEFLKSFDEKIEEDKDKIEEDKTEDFNLI